MTVPSPRSRGNMPWEGALYQAAARQAELLEECKADRARLIALVTKLRGRLREARERQELWELRQAEWRRERAFLLSQSDGRTVPSP